MPETVAGAACEAGAGAAGHPRIAARALTARPGREER